jgi:Plasmid pRiA4b ORF-3-like protein
MPTTPFQRLILRAVLRDVYPMVIRLVAVPDCVALPDFDDIFHAVLGWEGGTGYAFHVHGQEFNSYRRQARSKRLRDFRLHRHETFQYTLGAMDQWVWELRVVDRQPGASGDDTPVCVGGRGAPPPQYCGGPTGSRLMLKRQEALGDTLWPPAEIETVIGLLSAAHPDQPASAWHRLRSVLAEGCQSLDRRLEQSGPLAPERFRLREVNARLVKRLGSRRFA